MKKKPQSTNKNQIRKRSQRQAFALFLVGGLILLLAAVWVFSNNTESDIDPVSITTKGRPSLKVDQDLIDYGDVKLNTVLSFKIKLTNVGDQSLRIEEDPYVEVVEGC